MISSADLDEAAIMLTDAFSDGALFRAAFPQATLRRKILHRLFRVVIDDAARFGRVEIAFNHKIVGLLIWYPPGFYPMSFFRVLRRLISYVTIAAASPAGVIKLFRAQKTLNRLRPKRAHCHGYFLGGQRGENIGVVLSRRVLQEADQNRWPIYLETQEPRAIKLYARLGFKILHNDVETLPGGPLTWTMWREPQQETAPL
jgi:GNAT superfamily N-acetyltransferase